ncbi:hypothetical protein PSYPI_46559, partial [Pseudomonas syringae pv. pisi str. 1704B]
RSLIVPMLRVLCVLGLLSHGQREHERRDDAAYGEQLLQAWAGEVAG